MCRYINKTYKHHYACFTCRVGFKAASWSAAIKCLTCGDAAVNMGKDFRPPRQTQTQQWRKIALLVQHGYKFHSCGCTGPGYRPKTFGGAKRFVANKEYVSERYRGY